MAHLRVGSSPACVALSVFSSCAIPGIIHAQIRILRGASQILLKRMNQISTLTMDHTQVGHAFAATLEPTTSATVSTARSQSSRDTS